MGTSKAIFFGLALIGVLVSGPAWAFKGNTYTILSVRNCVHYMDAYSRTTFTNTGYRGPYKMWENLGWINGYLTAYNRLTPNGREDILGSMSGSDTAKWIGSWCRDNPKKNILDALDALIKIRSTPTFVIEDDPRPK